MAANCNFPAVSVNGLADSGRLGGQPSSLRLLHLGGRSGTAFITARERKSRAAIRLPGERADRASANRAYGRWITRLGHHPACWQSQRINVSRYCLAFTSEPPVASIVPKVGLPT